MMKQHFGWKSTRAGSLGAVARFSLVTVLAVLAGCATTGGGLSKDTPPEQLQAKVQERAMARWQALIDGAPDRSYEFVSPASKATITLDQYKERTKGAGVVYRRIEPESVKCEGETCKVKMYIWVDHRMMQGLRTPVDEVWILDKGQAWYVWRQ